MKRYILFLLLISFIYPRRDCLQEAERDALGRLTRLDKHTYAVSDSGYFYIHYDTTGIHAPNLQDLDPENGVPDYIDEVGIIADSAYHVLITKMKYNKQPSDIDGIYDIYVKRYGPGEYGYCYHEGNGVSYIQIDNDYGGNDSNYDQTPLKIMKVSLVHEYFHAIQYGYQKNHGSGSGSDAYFYEMTSTWIEDVIVPDGNDYLEGKWIDDLLDNPEGKFDNRAPNSCASCIGKGYELALFGHYLSHYVDPLGSVDEKQSTIMNKIWKEYSDKYLSPNNYDKPLVVIDRILQSEYQKSFIEVWIDFMSRNLFNGLYEDMDNQFYYYIDQALIEPIKTTPQSLNSISITLNLDNTSAFIKTFEIPYAIGELTPILDIQHGSGDYVGKIALLTIEINGNNLLLGETTTTNQLYTEDEVHFVYATEFANTDLIIDLILYHVPMPPSSLIAKNILSTFSSAEDSVELSWIKPSAPGNILYYLIYREDVNKEVIIDTSFSISLDTLSYVDDEILESSEYIYKVTCVNDRGESEPSNSVTIQSWPKEDDVTANQILSIYPNPVHKTNDSHILYALGSDYSNITLELINIRGQIVKTVALQYDQQGWHREKINSLVLSGSSAGIYFIRLRPNNIFSSIQKITILP